MYQYQNQSDTFYLETVYFFFSENNNEINCLDLSLSGSRFATAGKDLNVRIYDAETCKVNVWLGMSCMENVGI